MKIALNQAKKASLLGEVPVGAVIVDKNGEIIAQSHNRCEQDFDISAHAEILAIKEAAQKRQTTRLIDCDLWVTLEPCAMCATAISFARIKRLYFGAYDTKSGGIFSGPKIYTHQTIHHKPEVYGGIMEDNCKELMQDFFKLKR
ncbi:MAG: nucleoside deaminase [Alphaproteobacteria bacterium]